MKCNICKKTIKQNECFSTFQKTIFTCGKEVWTGTYCEDCTLKIEKSIYVIKEEVI